jgi:hypothetical protein
VVWIPELGCHHIIMFAARTFRIAAVCDIIINGHQLTPQMQSRHVPTKIAAARTTIQARYITDQAREQISNVCFTLSVFCKKITMEQALKATPVVLFMKGDPETPRCGFSRAVSQVIAAYEVPSDKLKTYDVLVDPELRQSIKEYS